MSLIISLVFITFLLCKMGGETAQAKNHDREIASWKAAKEVWADAATDRAIEEQYEYRLKTTIDHAQIEAEINRICPCLPQSERNYQGYMRVLMSQIGKVQWSDSVFGIAVPVYPASTPQIICRQKRMEFNSFIRWLDAELRKHGMKERMIFEPIISVNGRYYYELDEVDSLETVAGRFSWVPQSVLYHRDTLA